MSVTEQDIVERLRARANRRSLSVIDYSGDITIDYLAADEIERLREVLRQIARNTCCDECLDIVCSALGEGQ